MSDIPNMSTEVDELVSLARNNVDLAAVKAMQDALSVSLQSISERALDGDVEAQTTIVSLAASEQFGAVLENWQPVS